jgi:hypothetical protein
MIGIDPSSMGQRRLINNTDLVLSLAVLHTAAMEGRDFGNETPGDAMETRAMAARARAQQDHVSSRACVIALAVVLIALAGFALFIRYGR